MTRTSENRRKEYTPTSRMVVNSDYVQGVEKACKTGVSEGAKTVARAPRNAVPSARLMAAPKTPSEWSHQIPTPWIA